MYFHEGMAQSLADHSVDTIFGVIGNANLYMMDSFQRMTGGRYVSVSHEAGGVLAAIGYANSSGRIGVATVTCGPGLTNTITPLVEGVKGRTPVLLLAGDTSALDRDNLQNIPQRDVVLPTGAGFEQVRSPETFVVDVDIAIRRALVEHRPIVLNVPITFQWETVEYQRLTRPRYVSAQAVMPDSDALDSAVGIIASSQRPLVLAGRGAVSPEAREALLRLASRIAAPVATTLGAKDLFRGEPHNLDIFGTLSNPVALEIINESDCVIAFGAGLNKMTTADGSLLQKKQVVQIDLEPESINQWFGSSTGIVGDSTAVANTIVKWLDEAEIPPTKFASADLLKKLSSYSDSDFLDTSTEEYVDLRSALKRIDEAFPAERTLVIDGGRYIFTSYTMLHVPHPLARIHTNSYGSIGLGMGHAIGASFGVPERPVLLISGDGGFMLGGLAEFNTAVRHGVDLVVIVFNDAAYGDEHIQFRNRNMDPAISTFDWPDFAPVATALGGQGFTVRNLHELDQALKALETRDRPMLLDVKMNPDNVPKPGH